MSFLAYRGGTSFLDNLSPYGYLVIDLGFDSLGSYSRLTQIGIVTLDILWHGCHLLSKFPLVKERFYEHSSIGRIAVSKTVDLGSSPSVRVGQVRITLPPVRKG